MRKISSFLMAAAIAFSASAEGYQVNTLSAKQLGMGHTGTALKLGAESMLFNPAGMAFMESKIDISAGVTGIGATATATSNGIKYETDNKVSTPIFGYAAFSIYDNLKAGVSFTTPYGSSINWTNNWPGAILNQKVDLKTYSLQPTFSWKILPNLSVGAGLMISWGSVDLSKALVTSSSVDLLLKAMGQSYSFNGVTPASVNLKGTAQVALGYNVGVMYDVTKDITVGASFRSKMTAKVKSGDALVSYANAVAENLLQASIGVLNEANFTAEMPMPYIVGLGVSYRPMPKLQLAFDAQFTGWSAYKNLVIDFITEPLQKFNQDLEKNYKNAWAFRVGGEYALTERFDVRAGISYDNTPVDKDYYNPETPGMDKVSPSIGLSFRPYKGFSIDLGLSYVFGLGADDASYTYEDLIYKSYPMLGQSSQQKFTADYTTTAWVASIGLNYKF